MSSVLKALNKIYSVFEWIAKCFWYLAGASIVVTAFVASIGAISRYAFHAPIAITYDLTCVFMLIIGMFSLPYVQCQRGNLRLDLLDKVFPAVVTKAIANFLTPILSLLFAAVLTKECWGQATFAREIGEITKGNYPFPSVIVKTAITVCAGLLFLILLLQFLMFLCGLGKRTPDGGVEQEGGAE